MNATARQPTIADLLVPGRSLARDAAIVLAGGVLLAVLAQAAIPLPFTPVPLTGQTLGVTLIGLALGGRLGSLAAGAYLAGAAAGLPVLAGAAGGTGPLAGATGGYLLAFPFAAWLAGTLAERRGAHRTAAATAFAVAAGHAAIYAIGTAWLWAWARAAGVPADPVSLLAMGVLPFLPGDALKAVAAAALVPAVSRAAARLRA